MQDASVHLISLYLLSLPFHLLSCCFQRYSELFPLHILSCACTRSARRKVHTKSKQLKRQQKAACLYLRGHEAVQPYPPPAPPPSDSPLPLRAHPYFAHYMQTSPKPSQHSAKRLFINFHSPLSQEVITTAILLVCISISVSQLSLSPRMHTQARKLSYLLLEKKCFLLPSFKVK